ncbi:MAG: hypothetical protein ABH803_00805 [Candidatus Micrarchaeota archaeon]
MIDEKLLKKIAPYTYLNKKTMQTGKKIKESKAPPFIKLVLKKGYISFMRNRIGLAAKKQFLNEKIILAQIHHSIGNPELAELLDRDWLAITENNEDGLHAPVIHKLLVEAGNKQLNGKKLEEYKQEIKNAVNDALKKHIHCDTY